MAASLSLPLQLLRLPRSSSSRGMGLGAFYRTSAAGGRVTMKPKGSEPDAACYSSHEAAAAGGHVDDEMSSMASARIGKFGETGHGGNKPRVVLAPPAATIAGGRGGVVDQDIRPPPAEGVDVATAAAQRLATNGRGRGHQRGPPPPPREGSGGHHNAATTRRGRQQQPGAPGGPRGGQGDNGGQINAMPPTSSPPREAK